MNDQPLAGATFDVAMDALIAIKGPDVEFTFFRGTTDELKELAGECLLGGNKQQLPIFRGEWRRYCCPWLDPRKPKPSPLDIGGVVMVVVGGMIVVVALACS